MDITELQEVKISKTKPQQRKSKKLTTSMMRKMDIMKQKARKKSKIKKAKEIQEAMMIKMDIKKKIAGNMSKIKEESGNKR